MKCSEVIRQLERMAPVFLAEKWDNVGLLLGREEKEVKKIFLALDPSSEVVKQACLQEADMLITHHPLIFSGMKSVTTKDFIGRRVYELIRHDISYYAMHTNFDVRGMEEAVMNRLDLKNSEVLEATIEDQGMKEGIGRIGDLAFAMKLEDFAAYVKDRYHLSRVRVFGEMDRMITRVAIVPGSGKSFIAQALTQKADLLLTGDIGHHDGLDAMEQGMAVMDAGHYGLEKFFSSYMEEVLQKEFPGIEVHAAGEKAPFQTI